MVWDYYDGPRTGIADFRAKPHYFASLWDDRAGNYSGSFSLAEVTDKFLSIASEQWAIYRTWEFEFHSGNVSLETHPGHGGNHQRYDELEQEIERTRSRLVPLEGEFLAEFRVRETGKDLPLGCLRELDVRWSAA